MILCSVLILDISEGLVQFEVALSLLFCHWKSLFFLDDISIFSCHFLWNLIQMSNIIYIFSHFSSIFFLKIFIVIQLQLYAFSSHPSTPPQLNPPPSPTSALPLDFVHVTFIVVIPSSHCPLIYLFFSVF